MKPLFFMRPVVLLTAGALALPAAPLWAESPSSPQGEQQPTPSPPRQSDQQQASPRHASGQGDRPLNESSQEARKRTQQMREVSGTVMKLKNVGIRGSNVENRVALIRTNKGKRRIVVDLGPRQELQGLDLSEGASIAAEGRVVRVGEQQVLVARQVRQGGQTVQLQRAAQKQADAQRMKRLHDSVEPSSAESGPKGQPGSQRPPGQQ